MLKHPAILIAAIASLACLNTPSEARPRAQVATVPIVDIAARPAYPLESGRIAPRSARGAIYESSGYDATVILPHPAGCPRRLFCGCGVSVQVFGKPIRELFLASNWRKFPRGAAAPGHVAWRQGHVFLIEEVHDDGTVTAYDANSGGGLTRRHRVSLRGYRVVDPHGARMAENHYGRR